MTTRKRPQRRAPRSIQEYLDGPPVVSQETLAERLGVHQTTVSKLIKGQRLPGAALAVKLHEITGVSFPTLLKKRSTRKAATHADPADHDDHDSHHGAAHALAHGSV